MSPSTVNYNEKCSPAEWFKISAPQRWKLKLKVESWNNHTYKEKLKCWKVEKLKSWNVEKLKSWKVEKLKCWNVETWSIHI